MRRKFHFRNLFKRRKKIRRTSELPSYPRYRSLRRRNKSFKRLLRLGLIYGAAFALIVFAWFSYDLPDIEDLNKFTKAPSILIKAENGQIVGSFGDIYGDYVSFHELPASLIDAVIATEDRNFYYHFGIDPMGLMRAAFVDIKARQFVQGGSTITQQVAKNVFLTPQRSITRKIREMLLAVKLERRFTKQEIMSIYLNRVYLGAGNYGVDAAAKRYFGKPSRELTLPESAIIAGLLKAPSRFAPTSNPQLSRQRAEQVLLNMQGAGYLNEAQTTKAIEDLEKTMSARKKNTQSAYYFADWILDQLPEYVGNVQEDLVVTTTLRPDMQLQAEKAINDIMDEKAADLEASQAALVAMTPDGAVHAMVGGRSYAESQYNRATQALRQPGSSFKLFVYLAALEAGFSPSSLIEDQPVSVDVVGGTWQPKNYTNKYLGVITLREAVTHSINTVSVQVAMETGLDNVVNMARRLGITSDVQPLPSIALGSTEVTLLELTGAYAHLAAGGAIVNPYGITRINNARGEPVYERQITRMGRVLSPGVVGMMNDMLTGVVTSGTGRAAQFGRHVAGKTGTTSDYRDAWFMGFTPDLVAGVWVGNDNNSAMKKVTGGMLPAQIWRGFMVSAMAHVPAKSIPTEGAAETPLPWQTPGMEQPPGPGEVDIMHQMQHDQAPVAIPNQQQPDDNLRLGPSFWDKLMR